MARTLLTCAVLSSTLLLQAQGWCPPGAEWTFGYVNQMSGMGAHRLEHTGDTLIDGHQAQVLTHWVHYTQWSQPGLQTEQWADLYTYEEEDVVYLQGGWPLQFDTVMWSGAVPGDHWGVPDMPDLMITVLDTATVQVDGVPLRKLTVQAGPEGFYPPDTLLERIGFQWMFIRPNESLLTDGNYTGLLCYHDDELDYQAPNVTECDFTLSAPALAGRSVLPAFPNPGTDHFTVQVPAGTYVIELYDAIGHRVWQGRAAGGRALVDAGGWAPGLFNYRVLDAGGDPVGQGQWVKE